MNGLVYYIYHLKSGKGYVGKHDYPKLYARFNLHFRSKSPLGNALRKYGKESFKVVQLDVGTSVDELLEKETYWIETLNTLSPEGYNLYVGGTIGTSGWKTPEETKRALSIASKGNTNTKDYYAKGNIVSKETRRKLSVAASNPSEATRKALSIAALGYKRPPLSEECKKSLSKIAKDRNPNYFYKSLSDDQIRIIKNSTNRSVASLAKQFGVNWKTVYGVVKGTSYTKRVIMQE
jgi:group I intron endonuclease